MELSKAVLDGLGAVDDKELYKQLAIISCQGVISSNKKTPSLPSIDKQLAKLPVLDGERGLAEYKLCIRSMMTVFVEAARHNLDSASLLTFLEEQQVDAGNAACLAEVYGEGKSRLEIVLSEVGSHLPHVVDVDWSLDYVVKSNFADKLNQPKYNISLKTEKAGAETSNILFHCNPEQLQDLVSKLKDACKSVENAAAMS